MLISCTWLNELLEGRPIVVGRNAATTEGKLDANAVARALTDLGLEVEGVRHYDLSGVIVGEIREVSRHPVADRLNVVQLFDGEKVVQVVCGASNLPPVGGKVAFAPVGTVLPGGLELGARELRGVASQGMICSEDELEIGTEDDGIIVLPHDWEAGRALVDLIPGIRDSVIEIGVTPNRPDALGHIGVAIDLAVSLGIGTRTPKLFDAGSLPFEEGLVSNAAPQRCGRYLGYALEQVRVGGSPPWIKVRLHRVGLRSINDVVDVTNLVLMETGQPIHAFDRAKLAEQRVVVRTAKPGEPLTTLDGRTIELGEDDLAIADAERPQALAGVMGGADSMVDEATSRILLEVAWFEPTGVRRSARRHGFHTDASHRFERGVDHGGKLELAAKRALQLLVELTGASVVGRGEVVGERPPVPEIVLRPARIGELLGMSIAADEAARVLAGLGVRVDRSQHERWICRPPSFRPDLRREVDLIEEVMRHHGLDDLPAQHSPTSEVAEPLAEDPVRARAESIADALHGLGLHEHVALAFTSEAALAPFVAQVPSERWVRVANPLRQQASIMRTHLLPGLLDAVAHNHAHHDRELGLFEVGRIYAWPERALQVAPQSKTAAVDVHLPEERSRAAVLRSRRKAGDAHESNLARSLVADLLVALERVGVWAEARPGRAVEWLHPGVQIGLWDGTGEGARQIGVAGELHPDLVGARDLAALELAYGELWIDALPPVGVVELAEVARFPGTHRDLSLDLAVSIAASEVVEAINFMREGEDVRRTLVDEVDPVRPFAVELREDYRGPGVEPGRRALLVRLHYRALERSVTDAEVQELHDQLVSGACERLRGRDPSLRVR